MQISHVICSELVPLLKSSRGAGCSEDWEEAQRSGDEDPISGAHKFRVAQSILGATCSTG